MLGFFRRYQRFFFMITTVVIVISFSFFGVNSGGSGSLVNPRDEVHFYTDGGRAVTRGEVEDLVQFLNTDALDSRNAERLWGYNFLNDGVVRKEFLESGFAELLFQHYQDTVTYGVKERSTREKLYKTYKHPQAPFINADIAWNYFAPDVKLELDQLLKQEDPKSQEAFAARVRLFLAEKEFPAIALRQAILMQQGQQDWLPADPQLNHADLALFGYHTLTDWFGQDFLHLIAQVIINSAEKAEDLGYEVSNAEVKADLLRNSEINFRQKQGHPQMRLSHSGENYQEQLRIMQMGDAQVLPLWRQVMLFRRLFHDVGNSSLVDPLVYQKFNEYAKEGVNVYVYELPQAMRFRKFADLQRLEAYLKAVAADYQGLEPPEQFRDTAAILKDTPELVQKRYLLELAEVDKATLQTRVTVRDTWDWQVSDQGWDKLKQEFRELGIKPADSTDERFALIKELDGNTRLRVDSFTRQQIVEQHPEWLEEAIEAASMNRRTLNLRMKGGDLLIKGITDREALAKVLDAAELGESEDSLSMYTQDLRHYYRIDVVDRSAGAEVLSFAEASRDGVLDALVDRKLEAHYLKIRESNPLAYRGDNGEWRALGEVKRDVARDYFKDSIAAINDSYHNWRKTQPALAADKEKAQFDTEEDRAASRRLIPWMRWIHQQRMDNPDLEKEIVRQAVTTIEEGKLLPAPDLAQQFKLVKREEQVYRHGNGVIDAKEALALSQGDWSVLHGSTNGNIYFFHVGEEVEQAASVVQQMDEGRELLSKEARLSLFAKVLNDFAENETLDLEYLEKRRESTEGNS